MIARVDKVRSQAFGSFIRGMKSARTVTATAGAGLDAFASQRLKVVTKTGALVPLNLWPIQRRYMAEKERGRAKGHNHFILLKYRRGGFTTIEVAENYEITATEENTRIVTLAQSDPDTEIIFEIAKRYYDNDPARPFRRHDNKKHLRFPLLDSAYLARTAKGAHPFRGATLRKAHCTEVAFWYQGENQQRRTHEVIKSLMQSASAGEVVVESTPNGANAYKTLWDDATAGRNSFFPIFLPWFADDLNVQPDGMFNPEEIRDTLDDQEKFLLDHHGVGLNAIAWRRRKVLELGELFPQEYPENDQDCFLIAGHGFFSGALLKAAIRAIEQKVDLNLRHIHYEEVPGGYLVMWEQPVKGVEYIMASDASEGSASGDPNGAAIIRKDSGAQVAAFHGQFTPAEHFRLGDRVGRLYNNALWAVEREDYGHVIIRDLQQKGYPRVYHHDDGKAGWITSAVTRPQGLIGLRDWMVAQWGIGFPGLWDRHFLKECTTFRKQKDGQYAADSAAHDDCVMKCMIALEVRRRTVGMMGSSGATVARPGDNPGDNP